VVFVRARAGASYCQDSKEINGKQLKKEKIVGGGNQIPGRCGVVLHRAGQGRKFARDGGALGWKISAHSQGDSGETGGRAKIGHK